jgi:mannan endo-1,4-beta-mannosidase
MKVSSIFLLGIACATSAFGATILQAAGSDAQPAPVYPIGNRGGKFAKTAGRLFDLEGRVGYFAGNLFLIILRVASLTIPGSNAWWLAHLLENSDVDLVLNQVANVSLKSRPL